MLRLFTLALTLAALTAIATAPPASAKTLRWAGRGDLNTTDPHSQNENLTNNINILVYETLIDRDKKLALRPSLAESWQQVSPTVWRFVARRRQVPRRHAVHRRRRRVRLRARPRRHFAASRVCQRRGHPEEDRRPTVEFTNGPTRSSSSTSP
jgi:hypothetical protein